MSFRIALNLKISHQVAFAFYFLAIKALESIAVDQREEKEGNKHECCNRVPSVGFPEALRS